MAVTQFGVTGTNESIVNGIWYARTACADKKETGFTGNVYVAPFDENNVFPVINTAGANFGKIDLANSVVNPGFAKIEGIDTFTIEESPAVTDATGKTSITTTVTFSIGEVSQETINLISSIQAYDCRWTLLAERNSGELVIVGWRSFAHALKNGAGSMVGMATNSTGEDMTTIQLVAVTTPFGRAQITLGDKTDIPLIP